MHTTRKGRTEGDDDKSGLGGGRITHTGGVEKKRVPPLGGAPVRGSTAVPNSELGIS